MNVAVNIAARLTGNRSQGTFRALLRSLAEPGTIHSLPPDVGHAEIPPACWLALALADVDVSVCVDDDPAHPLAALIVESTGARVAPLDQAQIVTLGAPDAEAIKRLRTGSALVPEDGARLAVGVQDLAEGGSAGVSLELRGPGVQGRRTVGVTGLPVATLDAVRRTDVEFPAGIDTWFFTLDGRVMALPRSTNFTIEGN